MFETLVLKLVDRLQLESFLMLAWVVSVKIDCWKQQKTIDTLVECGSQENSMMFAMKAMIESLLRSTGR